MGVKSELVTALRQSHVIIRHRSFECERICAAKISMTPAGILEIIYVTGYSGIDALPFGPALSSD